MDSRIMQKIKLKLNKMAKVITLRLKDKELGFIKEMSKKENGDRSYADITKPLREAKKKIEESQVNTLIHRMRAKNR